MGHAYRYVCRGREAVEPENHKIQERKTSTCKYLQRKRLWVTEQDPRMAVLGG